MYSLSAVQLSDTRAPRYQAPLSRCPGGSWRGGGGWQTATLPATAAMLSEAMRRDQIQAWFQPKVSVMSRALHGVEALARWMHPMLGMITPSVFLPWFNRHGLDEALLMHMLGKALNAQAQWRRQGRHVPVSVNLPTHLLDDEGLPERLLDCVRQLAGQASDITFELLETSDTATSRPLLLGATRLVSMGFGLAQDDFGVGYSSMGRLACLPFTEVKLDRSFVHGVARDSDQTAATLVFIQASHRLGLAVTAEGVETQEDLAFLRQAGCDHAQGYLFAKPMPAQELLAWMRSQMCGPEAAQRRQACMVVLR